jgi:hypothetical protein
MKDSGNINDKKKDPKKSNGFIEPPLDTLIQRSITNNKVLARMLENLQKKPVKNK